MKKKLKLKKSAITFLVVLLMLVISIIMFYFAYYIYSNNRKVSYYSGKKVYSYIKPSSVSSPIAEYGKGKFYVVTDINDNIFIVFINNKNSKKIISNNSKIYGYPTLIDDTLKNIIVKDINRILPYDRKLDINKDNYYKYVTKYYLDNSVRASYKFNYIVFILLLLFMLFIILSIVYVHKKHDENV